MDTSFLIAGVGASAGGIQALRRFFEQVSADSGVAYVVILHLSPTHESRLAEVLQTSASIPVTQARGQVRVEPNHVYVISPNQSLSMAGGDLVVSTVTSVEERRAPIDIFFRTLAESHRSRAVCVILSGTGADGSMGMKRVKERGGICLVQDPHEAEHGDMPRNAIATALVDHTLPVAEIPAKILAYRESVKTLRLSDERPVPPSPNEQALHEIFEELRANTGHDFSDYKRATVLRRLARRMGIREITELPVYARYLGDHPGEVHSLLKDLLISVTNFFRDREAFETLEKDVIPRLFEGKGEEGHVRVWVAGCATGEEAYSVAMLLAEHAATLKGASAIQVFATDIDEAAIAAAREGAYTLNDAADVPARRLRRFFSKEGSTYRVRKELRERILFARHNIIKDPPFSHLDLVSCRNLLIYLNRSAQQQVMEIAHFALNPGGFLFLGSSEAGDGGALFTPVDAEAHIFQARRGTRRGGLPFSAVVKPYRAQGTGGVLAAAALQPPHPVPAAELHQRLLEQYAPPSIVVDGDYEIVHLSERAGRFLQFTGGDPSHNVLKVVRPEIRLELRTALLKAAQQQADVEARGLTMRLDDGPVVINVLVRPIPGNEDAAPRLFLILFEAAPERDPASATAVAIHREDTARQLEGELLRVKAQLRETVGRHASQAEELKASNEELQAINEELRSTAEEFETGKEELQSLNQELRAVNQELKTKIDEQAQANDDIRNLIDSAEIGTIFLDRGGRIKLFTPKARELFNLIPSDCGRPLSDINSVLIDGDLAADAALVIERHERVEREMETRDGRWHLMRAAPYRTADERIDGVVVTFVDITARKRSEDELVAVRNTLAADLAAMTLLHDLSTRMLAAGDTRALLDEVLTAAVTLLRADFGTLLLCEAGTGKLRLAAEHGFPARFMTDPERQRACGEAARPAIERRTRIVIEDTEANDADAPSRALAAAVGYRASQHTPLFDRAGEALGVLSTYVRDPRRPADGDLQMLDLYARQAAEVIAFTRGQEALRKSENRLRRALEIETVGVLFFTRDGAISYANDAFVRMSGYAREELAAGGMGDTASGPKWAMASTEALEEFDATGRIAPHEKEYVRGDGSRGWAVIAAARLDQHEGVGFVIDLTAAREVQEQLRQSEERLELIAESVTDYAIFTLGATGTIDSWSPGAVRLFGFSEEEAVGQSGAIVFTPEDRERGAHPAEMARALKTGRALDDRWLMRRNASRFFARGIMSPLFDATRDLIGYVKITRDLTERNYDELQLAHDRLEARVAERTEALATANRALDLELQERRHAEETSRALVRRLMTVLEDERRRIARDLHDHLGQQVAGVSFKLAALEHSLGPDSPTRPAVSEVHAVIEQLDRGLDFFTWELRPAALDDLGLAAALSNYVHDWSTNFNTPAEFHSAGLEGLRLERDIETNLYRIAQEALNNVHKHAGASRVGVLLERRNQQVVLVVEDDGAGFGPEAMMQDSRDGGMGIAGMQERAALIGGSLDIETAPGKGTTVFARVDARIATDAPNDDR